MEAVLEEIEFLALSANRVEVLERLAAEPRTRAELAAATGASQATLGRILRDFRERSWIEREGGAYVATATGHLVADGFGDLLDVFETEAKLRGVASYLPVEALGFDLRRLADATVTVPTGPRPNAPVQRGLDILADAGEVRVFSHAFNEGSLDAIAERTADGETTFAGVFSRTAIDALADDAPLRRRLASLLDAEDAELRVYDDEIPLAVTVADDAVHLLVRDETGVLRASVDTDDPAVRAWARERFDAYWTAATPLDRDDFAVDRP
ncbi:MAG: helix-turn-helix transcriptional regulator [Haloplanus sp.]